MGERPRPPATGRRWLVGLVRSGLPIAILIGPLALSGCASTGPAPVVGVDESRPVIHGRSRVPKGYYRVREGDSLGSIAARHHVSVERLIRWNGLRPPYTLYRGRVLRVTPPKPPVARSTARSRGGASTHRSGRKAAAPVGAPATPGSRAAASALSWAWPLGGALQQGFRAGDPARQGLRIGCRPGEEVRAAAPGRVAYSGSGLKGYGNLIIVKHNKNYLSAYGFNRRLFVHEGDGVTRGQVLAECGEGPGGAPMLHFEVRRNGAAVNPLLYLPPRD